MIQQKGICSSCKRFGYYANKKYELCMRCNSTRIRNGKKKAAKDCGLMLQSESQLFYDIWEERPHVCYLTFREINFPKGSPLWFSCFAHVLPKGRFKEFKYLKDNIILVLPEVHYAMDMGTKDSLFFLVGVDGVERLQTLKKNLLQKYLQLEK